MKHYLAILFVLLVARSSATELKELVRNPAAYHHRRVTVIGVARVEGLTFELYANPADASSYARADRALSISQNAEGPRYDKYDNRWVKLVGVVDANRHGMWGYPCIIFLESVQPLAVPPAGKQHVVISGAFRNDDSRDVSIVLFDQAGKTYAEFPVPGRGTNGTGLRRGTAEIREPSGNIISRYSGLLSDQDARYLDAVSQTYYYHITKGKIEGVSPNDAKKWPPRKTGR
jgi:hypothetical protein